MEKAGAAKGRQAGRWPVNIRRAALVGNRLDNVMLPLHGSGQSPCRSSDGALQTLLCSQSSQPLPFTRNHTQHPPHHT